MNIATVKKNDIANGPGVRVSVFVSGCRHFCKGCFNSEAWDFSFGEAYTDELEKSVLDAAARPNIAGLSFLGGEPLEPENQGGLVRLARAFRERCPEKTIWCYTGFLYEDIVAGRVGDGQTAMELLKLIDVLVDGKFIEEQMDLALLFRGSRNQRIIDVKKSLNQGKAVILDGVWERKMGSGNIDEL